LIPVDGRYDLASKDIPSVYQVYFASCRYFRLVRFKYLELRPGALKAEDEDTLSVESTFSAKWAWFIFEDPELDWSTTLQIIPSLPLPRGHDS